MFLPANADLTYDFLACLFALGMVAFVLLIGSVTRASAVAGLSIVLLCCGAVVFGLWFAFRLDDADGPMLPEWAVLRRFAGVAGTLLFAAGYLIFRLGRRRRQQEQETGELGATPVKALTDQYDRAWLLSLLQERSAKGRVKVATPDDAPDASETPPAST